MAETRVGQPVGRRLGEFLVAEGLLEPAPPRRALAEQKGTTEKLGPILIRPGLVDGDQLLGLLSRHCGVPAITLSQLDIDPDLLRIRDLILRTAPSAEIRQAAESQGMTTLRQSGLLTVIEGTTTVEEILRVTAG